MRLIAHFAAEKEAYGLYCFFVSQGLESIYEPYMEAPSSEKRYAVWIYNEEDLAAAQDYATRYKQNPADPFFAAPPPQQAAGAPPPPTTERAPAPKKGGMPWQLNIGLQPRARPTSFVLTQIFLFVCIFLFLWNTQQDNQVREEKGLLAEQLGLTPLQEALMFDYPKALALLGEVMSRYPLQSAEDIDKLPPEGKALFEKADMTPSWRGVYDLILRSKRQGAVSAGAIPMFEKIRQGEIWRLFTPVLLHYNFLHILFNMAWLFVLGKQIEERTGPLRMLFMVLLIGVASNVAQYLMSGPAFVGFSGVIVGMAGFIWVRQKLAPWEGYPLQKGTLLFLLLFIIAMFVLELISFALQFFSVVPISANIANTAHIVGGLIGMGLARIPLFSKAAP